MCGGGGGELGEMRMGGLSFGDEDAEQRSHLRLARADVLGEGQAWHFRRR